jgi:hypothetical protein
MADGVSGKKKRGEAGKKNAECSPYRLNGGGLYPLYMRRILGPVLSALIGKKPD